MDDSAHAWPYLQRSIILLHGEESILKRAVGSDWKGKISPVFYICGIVLTSCAPGLAQVASDNYLGR